MSGIRKWYPLILIVSAPLLVALTISISILYGAKDMDAQTIIQALFHFDPNQIDHQIIMQSRLPREIGTMLIGAFLAVSGALMQGMTRNYLASPSIMGVSDGSVLMITLCMILLPGASSLTMIVYSLIGSAIGAGIVFGLAWLLPNGTSPVRMAILGTIIGTFMSGVAEAAATYFQVSQSVSFWYNARLDQIDPVMIRMIIPFAIAGMLLALILARSITVLSMGDEIAAGLGQRTGLIKGLSMLAVVLLTGVSVALAGKIAFVGLLVPHMTRYLVGVDYRRVIPCSALFGGIFLGWCDILSRWVNAPFETPIGVITALFGVPFFLYLIRRKGGKTNEN
ncbi:FecCD family ABC transporter permease [Paenibacillus shenyangensis]|uniref:FecCD family ABC transporter permease n=1 Tax=Paenibacillus sp. A9 TaxID=1284352 RepID=UPI00037D7569|nr:iron ABC transporter permease [Paenibacillus sp. A9]